MQPLNHQIAPLAEIAARASVFFTKAWHGLPIQPRWATLMVGPSGTGKTAIAAMAAEAVGASMLRISSPGWIPSGAHNRGTLETISVVVSHVISNDKTILVCDELDKIADNTGDTSWKSYIRGEIYDLIDGRWPTGLKIPENEDEDSPVMEIGPLTKKLQQSVFVVGIGTFQAWYDTNHRHIGFVAEADTAPKEISADIVAEKIPRELANRFHTELIQIPQLKPRDYHRIAREAENKLPVCMQQAFRTAVARRITGAITAKKGVRYLEEAIMEVLKNLPPEPDPVSTEFIDLQIFRTNDIDPCTL